MGECKRQGAWLVPHEHTAFALMGSVVLDLREATFASNHITINASAIMGEVRVLVDAHTHVVMDGTPIMGEFSQGKDKTPPRLSESSPTVRLRGVALMGSVTVVRQPPPGTPRKFLGTY
jgi:Cell wall-active antibiotics response 4TMS YvqF